jgi:hypothetical protein
MAIIISNTVEITFRAADFLVEAIDDFLDSGINPRKIGGSIIKIAVGTELLLKEKLESICPALILKDVGKRALQVAKLYELGSKMRDPALLDNEELQTASFGELLSRADLFFSMGRGRKHLEQLYKMRNKLVHHRSKLDLSEANLLIINRVVPFLQQFTKDDPEVQVKIGVQTWKRLRKIANSSTHYVYGQFAKRVEQHAGRSAKLSQKMVSQLLSRARTLASNEQLLAEALLCPACGYPSMTALAVEQELTWLDDSPFVYEDRGAVCKVCTFSLNDEDVELYLDHWETFHGTKKEKEKQHWRKVFASLDDLHEILKVFDGGHATD